MLCTETLERDVSSRDVSRLDGNGGETSLALVLLAVDIVVVTNLNGLQILIQKSANRNGLHFPSSTEICRNRFLFLLTRLYHSSLLIALVN